MRTQKIIPHLWFNNEVKEATNFYVNIFPDSKIENIVTLHNTPSGDSEIVTFKLLDYSFMAINGGPYYKFTPAISFVMVFEEKDKNAKSEIKRIWDELISGGIARMPLQEYDFSKLYGWVEDKYGVNWQLMLVDGLNEEDKRIIPHLLFTEDVAGRAEEATNFYISNFKNSKRESIYKYPSGMEPDKEGTVMFTDFYLEGICFAAADSAREHNYTFTPAISLIINCESQAEIDYYWDKLSYVKEAEACGWLVDKYGVSWQVNPALMDEMFSKATKDELARITKAFLPMKKIEIEKIVAAYKGNK